MGTRALVNFARGDDVWATIYVHSDGYPTGLGAHIKDVLGGAVMRNGIRDDVKQVNGPGCAAAQFVAALKDGAGQIYIYKTGAKDVGEDYVYTVYASDDQPLSLRVVASMFFRPEGGRVIYDGLLTEFDPKKVEASED